jgi:hypothetical protein
MTNRIAGGEPGVGRRNRMREKPGFPAHSHVSREAWPNGMAGWGGRYRTSIWRFRTRLISPVREELQNPNFVGVHKPLETLETLEFGEPYRTRGVQSSGEKWAIWRRTS